MKNKICRLFVVLMAMCCKSVLAQTPAEKLNNVFNRSNHGIMVAAHRGDWRNAPENSLNALLNCIDKGFDMMELDVKITKDSQLVVMHDNTIDRTTNGKGSVSDFTLAALKKFKLKNGLGRVTENPIPTFKEMMLAAKGKILINVDKGNDQLPTVFKVLEETGTLAQAIVNIGDQRDYDQLLSTTKIPNDAAIMVVVNLRQHDAISIIKSYSKRPKSVIQPVFNTDTLTNLKELPQIAKNQVLWLNSLWPSLNGGHDDDRAIERKQPDEAWGWLIDHKPLFIQSDRPEALMQYLKSKKLHQ